MTRSRWLFAIPIAAIAVASALYASAPISSSLSTTVLTGVFAVASACALGFTVAALASVGAKVAGFAFAMASRASQWASMQLLHYVNAWAAARRYRTMGAGAGTERYHGHYQMVPGVGSS